MQTLWRRVRGNVEGENVSDMIDKIRNAAAWDECAAFKAADDDYFQSLQFEKGARYQHAQTQWAFEALEIALGALDEYAIICGGMESMFENTPTKRAKEKIAALVPKGDHGL